MRWMRKQQPKPRLQHVCKTCNEPFSNEHKLRVHRRTHKKKKASGGNCNFYFNPLDCKYVCNTCDSEFGQLEDVKKHMETHEEKYICEVCEELFTDPYKFAVHNYVHNSDAYRCPFCSMKTASKNSLNSHIKKVHLQQFSFACRYCGKGYDDRTYLREHEEMHTKGTKFTCIVCNKDYPFSRYLQQHQIRYHKVNIEGVLLPNQCPICLKIYSKPKTLEEHAKRHEASGARELKHLCDICGKGFAQSDKLKLHYRVHTGDKPYSCQYCDKSFTKKDYLIMHERIHSGEKPYSCEYCGKCFNQSAPLRIHIRGHTGEKPYVCHICNTGFSSKAGLKAHFKRCNG